MTEIMLHDEHFIKGNLISKIFNHIKASNSIRLNVPVYIYFLVKILNFAKNDFECKLFTFFNDTPLQ